MRTSGALKSLEYGVTTDSSKRSSNKYLAKQENIQTVVGDGLYRRQPLEVVKSAVDTWLVSNPTGSVYTQSFEMYDKTYWLIVFYEGTTLAMKTMDSLGVVTDVTVDPLIDTAYFIGLGKDDIDISVNGDTLYVTNKTLVVRNLGVIRNSATHSYIKIVRAPLAGTTVKVTYEDMSSTVRTVSYPVSTAAGGNGTDIVATGIVALISAQSPNLTSIANRGSSIAFGRNDGEYAKVSVEDNEGGAVMKAINGHTPDVLNLPNYVLNSNIIKIAPDNISDRGTYYMQSVVDSSTAPPPAPVLDTIVTAGTNTIYPYTYTGYHGFPQSPQFGSIAPPLTVDGVLVEILHNRHNDVDGSNYIEIFGTTGFEFTSPTSITWITIIFRFGLTEFLVCDVGMVPVAYLTGKYYFRATTPGRLLSGGTYDIYINQPSVASSTLDQVIWEETSAAGETYKLDPTSMPVIMTRDIATDDFTANLVEWDDKHAGSNKTNPDPAFVGSTINDTSIFQNRLVCLTHDEI